MFVELHIHLLSSSSLLWALLKPMGLPEIILFVRNENIFWIIWLPWWQQELELNLFEIHLWIILNTDIGSSDYFISIGISHFKFDILEDYTIKQIDDVATLNEY